MPVTNDTGRTGLLVPVTRRAPCAGHAPRAHGELFLRGWRHLLPDARQPGRGLPHRCLPLPFPICNTVEPLPTSAWTDAVAVCTRGFGDVPWLDGVLRPLDWFIFLPATIHFLRCADGGRRCSCTTFYHRANTTTPRPPHMWPPTGWRQCGGRRPLVPTYQFWFSGACLTDC